MRTEIVVKYNPETKNFQIYEATTKTLLLSDTLGEGFSNLNLFLKQQGVINDSILTEDGILYHIDAHTFNEIIKSNLELINRVREIPSEFKNSADRFNSSSLGQSKNSKTPKFGRGSKNFQQGKMTGFKKSGFNRSIGKFGKNKYV